MPFGGKQGLRIVVCESAKLDTQRQNQLTFFIPYGIQWRWVFRHLSLHTPLSHLAGFP
jgi:hypothetical protein